MAWTESDLTKIEKAISEGVLTVKYDTKIVTYRSLDEMLKIRDLIKRELGTAATNNRRYASSSKGLDGC